MSWFTEQRAFMKIGELCQKIAIVFQNTTHQKRKFFKVRLEKQETLLDESEYLDKYFKGSSVNEINAVVEVANHNFEQYEKEMSRYRAFEEMRCPIGMNIMVNPVITECGHTFEELHLFFHLQASGLCPICRR